MSIKRAIIRFFREIRKEKTVVNNTIAANNRDVWIVGPSLADDPAKSLNALYALHYLPENYKLVLLGSSATQPSFLTELAATIARDGLQERVRLTDKVPVGAIQLADEAASQGPEAAASAILRQARTRA